MVSEPSIASNGLTRPGHVWLGQKYCNSLFIAFLLVYVCPQIITVLTALQGIRCTLNPED